MPHFVLEHSSPLPKTVDLGTVFGQLSQAAAATGTMALADIKLRAIAYESFQLNVGSRTFVHLTISLLEGRTPAQKEHLTTTCRQVLVDLCPQIDAISIDIRDMDAAAYKKHVVTRAE